MLPHGCGKPKMSVGIQAWLARLGWMWKPQQAVAGADGCGGSGGWLIPQDEQRGVELVMD
jgi:hypothetical protein